MTLRSCGYEESSSNYLPLADRANLRRRVGNGAEFRGTSHCWRRVWPQSPSLQQPILRVSQRTRIGRRSVNTLFRYWHTISVRCAAAISSGYRVTFVVTVMPTTCVLRPHPAPSSRRMSLELRQVVRDFEPWRLRSHEDVLVGPNRRCVDHGSKGHMNIGAVADD